MHRTAGGIVLDAVFDQIKKQAVDQGVAALDADLLTFLKKGDATALCQRGQVGHDLIGQRSQLDKILARDRLQIAHFQQCADKACQTGHLIRLKAEQVGDLAVGIGVFLSKHFQLCLHDGQRCFQLMGGIAGKLTLQVKGLRQPVQHTVDGLAQVAKFRDRVFL